MASDQQPDSFGARHGVTILTVVIATLFILVCIIQVKSS
jgi:hypothetical protein